MSYIQPNPIYLGSRSAREVTPGLQSYRRQNVSRQDSSQRKPSTSAGRKNNSKDKSNSFNNSSFLNTSQLENPRTSLQNTTQDTSLTSYIQNAFNKEKQSQNYGPVNTGGIANILSKKDTKSPITSRQSSRPSSRLDENQRGKVLGEVQLNSVISQEEFRQREFQYLMRIAGLEKENGRIKMQMQKSQNMGKQNVWDEQMERSVIKLQQEKGQLQAEVNELKESLNQLSENLSAQMAENAVLKKYVSTHTSKRSDSKSNRMNTQTSTSSVSYKYLNPIQEVSFNPAYLVALSLASYKK